MKLNKLILCSALGFAATQALACYTVYDQSDRVVYQSLKPPVDMSRPLHETLPARFPGGHMIFNGAADCPVISSVASGRGGLTLSGNSPLLTDQRTALAMGLPHTMLPSGVALIQQKDAKLPPGITVVPTKAAPSSAAPSTAVMGAGPSRGTVITELRDPPMTVEERGGRYIVRESAR